MQVLVIGAGVVGLAVARQAALAGYDVIVAEATSGIGNGVSSRNSEVIHGGMYYPTGSLPALACIAAVHSPETGIIDSHGFMLALEGELEDRGGMIAFETEIERLTPGDRGWTVHFSGKEAGTLDVDAVVNSAGLGAQALAKAT